MKMLDEATYKKSHTPVRSKVKWWKLRPRHSINITTPQCKFSNYTLWSQNKNNWSPLWCTCEFEVCM